MTKSEVFEKIADSSIFGNLGLFLGSGFSVAILNSPTKKVALSWPELIYKCAQELKIDLKDIHKEGISYPEIATQICKKYAEQKSFTYQKAVKIIKELIAALTSWYPEEFQRIEYENYLKAIDPSWIITTNYDLVIESILTGKAYSLAPSNQLIAPKDFIPVYHLHGIRTTPSSIIFTNEDYIALFRPNQYRQQKLILTIRESLTLLIGYNLADFNVLSAVDWSKNVFDDQKKNDIIQFSYAINPKKEPYIDVNGMIILEFDSLPALLEELSVYIEEKRVLFIEKRAELKEVNQLLQNPTHEAVEKFIQDDTFRNKIIDLLKENDNYLISGFLVLFSKSMDESWKSSKRNYDGNLKILFALLENLSINSIPPALIESILYNFNRVAYYLNSSNPHSTEWLARINKLPKETKIELRNIANARSYRKIGNLLKKVPLSNSKTST